jgi:membrane-bound lytic murein transglycosylase D
MCLTTSVYSIANELQLVSMPKSNIWEALTHEFALNHQVDKPEVQKQLKWMLKHPEQVTKMATQAKPFIYHILNEIRKRNLPGELALIPMIESEYDPFSSSNRGAAGIWQIMPHTATELGITKNWWVDGRRSIGPSTNAALNYLTYLHRFFHGNWTLAVAAYDSGEGTVLRAVKHRPHKEFWSLSLPDETKNYIPKLFALSEIIKHPQRYHIVLPEIEVKPYFIEVDIDKKLKLNHIAKLTNMPAKEMHRLNAGFKDWSSYPNKPYKLLVPTDYVDDFYRNLANIPKATFENKPQEKSKKHERKSRHRRVKRSHGIILEKAVKAYCAGLLH